MQSHRGGRQPSVKIKRNDRTAPARARARRVLRREVDWNSRYMIEASRDQTWSECRVLDVSRGGAGLMVSGVTADQIDGRRLVVELEIPPAVLRVRGEVRHAGTNADGDVHVGIRFDNLTALEQDLLESLLDHSPSR
jgi:c-di-GMP-binding flagellar brake protein YcgR